MKPIKNFLNESIKNEDLFSDVKKPDETVIPKFCERYDAKIKNKIITFDESFGPVSYDEDWIRDLAFICKTSHIKKVEINDFYCCTSKKKLDFMNVPFEVQVSVCICGEDQKLVIENLNIQSKYAVVDVNGLKECTFKNSYIYGLELNVEDCEVKFDKINNNQFLRARYRIFKPGSQENLYNKASETSSIEQRDALINNYIKSINLNLKSLGSNKAEFVLEKCGGINSGTIEITF